MPDNQGSVSESQVIYEPVSPAGSPPLSQNSPETDERKKAIEAFMKRNEDASTINLFDTKTADKKDTRSHLYAPTQMFSSGQVISESTQEHIPTIIKILSSFFFGITFTYSTLSLILFGVLVALTIALTNAGSPGFMYLRYYPKIGLLPIFAAAAAMVFMYVAYKLRDGSRLSWIMAVVAVATLPATFSAGMPVLSYPLVKLVSVYAGSPEKPLLTPGITVSQLTQLFSVFLVFDLLLVALLLCIRYFHHQSHALSQNAKTSLLVLFLCFFVPTSAVAAYGYYDAGKSDYGFSAAQQEVPYTIYISRSIPGGRTLASKYQTREELAYLYNAVKVIYDVPLPVVMQTGKNSPITLKQVLVSDSFSLEKYVAKQERDADTQIEEIPLENSMAGNVLGVRRGTTSKLFTKMPGNVLIEVSSDTATQDELVELISTLE
jgi:hypothetical protein